MKLFGLTGGIASGKSTVAQILRDQGFVVLSADILAREVVQPGEQAYQDIVDTFGSEVVQEDGQLDRAALGRIVFANPEKRKQLEGITHPSIAQRAAEQIAEYAGQGQTHLFYEVPLLFETNMQAMFHATILVALSPEEQQKRLQQREGLTNEEALQRIQSQMPLEEKQALADYVIDNSGTLDDLQREVQLIIDTITKPRDP
ncbi:MAG: dephospho-CoA kinase [Deltaproteobacteria bacterium]|nr:MAG: dephospho-CoA kinase [Deltaproteobacteria bacterium]